MWFCNIESVFFLTPDKVPIKFTKNFTNFSISVNWIDFGLWENWTWNNLKIFKCNLLIWVSNSPSAPHKPDFDWIKSSVTTHKGMSEILSTGVDWDCKLFFYVWLRQFVSSVDELHVLKFVYLFEAHQVKVSSRLG